MNLSAVQSHHSCCICAVYVQAFLYCTRTASCISVDCVQVLYRESLVVEDWELDESAGGERTARDSEEFRWELSESRRSLLGFLEAASRSSNSDAQVLYSTENIVRSVLVQIRTSIIRVHVPVHASVPVTLYK